MTTSQWPEAQAILNFWFDDPAAPDSEYGQQRQIWFRKDPDFDQQVRDRFLPLYEQARRGECDRWLAEPSATLALTILLDQFPRNMFRGTARCLEADDQALATAETAIARHYDQALLPVERVFFYLPFEHSENIEHQEQAVSLFETLVQVAPELQSTLDYAYRHRDVIAQFGRFPIAMRAWAALQPPPKVNFSNSPALAFSSAWSTKKVDNWWVID
ncbi:DUF924 family protein [Leptolyngbya iicbica]|uniref:DUF924 family protein n=1 Tax=Leptolyngbya iicbica TaxID=3161580 RepID=UPI0026A87668